MTELGVLVPTRARPQNMERIVQAWHGTGAFGAADLIIGVDVDDAQLDSYIEFIRSHPEVRVIQLDKWAPMVQKLNLMATMSMERYPLLAFMGDDHLPRTPMWAHALVQTHRFNQAAIVYGRDGYQDEKLPTWWSMDSRIVQRLGKMVPAPVQHLFCDNAVKELGLAIKSLVFNPQMLIEHMHPAAFKGDMDAQYARVNRLEQYERDGMAFREWTTEGMSQDATLLADIWG